LTEAPPLFGAEFAEQFGQLLRWRRDVRHFDTRPVAEEEMAAMLSYAAWAPSVGNSQPWRFVRLRKPALREELVSHVEAANMRAAERYAGDERQQHYLSLKLHGLREAPQLLAVYCDEQPQAGHGLGIATMPEMLRYSCVMAIHNLWLGARLRGIGVGWVSILDPDDVSTLLDVPQHWSLIALLCIGYPVEETITPDLEKRGWQAREALAERIFER